MERRLLQRKIRSDSQKMLNDGGDEDEYLTDGLSHTSRSRSDSLPTESVFSTQAGKRRQSLPSSQQGQGIENTEKLLKEGILKLQNSVRNLDSAKKTVQDILDSRRHSSVGQGENEENISSRMESSKQEQQPRNASLSISSPRKSPPTLIIQSPQSSNHSNESSNFMSKFGRWMKSKWDDKYASKSADKDVKKAVKGVEEAGEVINQMEDSLLKAEEELRVRALALRRQSADAFKLVSSGIKTINISYDEEEEENMSSKSEERICYSPKRVVDNDNEEDDIDEVIKQFENKNNNNNNGKKYYEQQVTNL
ncbi:uncharacterized protein [Lepeophtheirus salmonis]|uniref:uncharacterized protein isoform X2 n=1 Tax=Lepeophtheirus salmonis TaxID=72036 RepID=UPI001AE99396|nr:uncharacterized protein LOC121115855 isoform X2 [Lepeophtheirus salmonis]